MKKNYNIKTIVIRIVILLTLLQYNFLFLGTYLCCSLSPLICEANESCETDSILTIVISYIADNIPIQFLVSL